MNWTQEQLDALERDRLIGVGRMDTPLPMLNIKPPKPRMNKWETEYDALLRHEFAQGDVDWWGFEAINIRLADGARYTPDFSVIRRGVLEFVEVKGHLREAALVRFKVAAALVPLKFTMLRKKKVKEGGGWETMRVLNGEVR